MKSEPIRETRAMIAGMTPRLTPGTWCFCTDPAPPPEARAAAIAAIREDEGVTLILAAEDVRRFGYPEGPAMRRITLDLNTSLEGIGLTAAISTALGGAGIACNVVAAYYHDHVFVPADRADIALTVLENLAAAV